MEPSNSQKPLVSVLMTCYNRERYMKLAIDSVLASSFRDFELIIVDDRSTDTSLEIAKAYAAADSRVRVFLNETNLGDYPNRNKAASLARGKYLKYVDSDDFMYPWGLEILVHCMEAHPEAGWGLCSLNQNNDQPYPILLGTDAIFRYHNFKSPLFHKAPLSSIIKKEVFDAVGGFSGKRQIGDTEMWHILALKYPVLLMPGGIVWYRYHPDQEYQQVRDEIEVRMRYPVSTLHFYQQTPEISLTDDEKQQVMNKIKSQLRRELVKNFITFRWGNVRKIMNAIKDHQYDFKKV